MKLSKTSLLLLKSQSSKLTLHHAPGAVSWSSSNESVASVSFNGKVTAKDAGNATITAKVHGKKFKCKVTAAKPKVQKVTLKQTTITMGYNKDAAIKITVAPQNVQKYYRTTVKSSDKSIVQAEISPNGKSIYLSSGEKTGTAIISVTV